LTVFRRERTLTRMEARISALSRLLRPLSKLAHVGDIRQRGYMVGIELVKDRATRIPYPLAHRIGHRVAMEARRRGLVIRPLGHVMVLMPDRKSTRLNSSHEWRSYAVFCLKKKKIRKSGRRRLGVWQQAGAAGRARTGRTHRSFDRVQRLQGRRVDGPCSEASEARTPGTHR